MVLLYNYAYFKAFNVDITTFVSISDLYVLLIDLIPSLIYFFVFLFFIFFLMFGVFNIIRKIAEIFKKKNNDQLEEESSKSKKVSHLEVIIINLIPFSIFYTHTTIYAFPFALNPRGEFYNGIELFSRFMMIFIIIVSCKMNLILIKKYSDLLKKLKLGISKLKLYVLALTVFYISGIVATLDAGKSMYYEELEIVEFVYKGIKLSSKEKNIVYVGRTSEYVFIYFKDSTITKSYKVSEIKDLNFFNSMFYRSQMHKKHESKG
ncbi:hypothetical protein BWZ20_02705 [Winogradskyella sp. J14-2]|nr:hypothetical protein BWZ20_02705 [Winogradskyella sp. J14-2]